jgi:hypothetical protein
MNYTLPHFMGYRFGLFNYATKLPGRLVASRILRQWYFQFGIFFEDLNYAADGGLYAELIQNRSFEYSPTEQIGLASAQVLGLQKRGGGEGSVGVPECGRFMKTIRITRC